MPLLEFAVALALIGVIIALDFRARRFQPSHKRKLDYGPDGQLAAIGERDHTLSLQFKGVGSWNSKPITLTEGSYRLDYHFPDAVMVRVGLIFMSDAAEETLLIKSGRGAEEFAVDGGRYLFQVQPIDENAAWQIDCRRIKQRMENRV